MTDPEIFVCLTCDVVASRLSEDRESLQDRIEASLAEANRGFADKLSVGLSVTLGDEWQGLFRAPEAALEVDLFLRARLYPFAVRSGLGFGGISTPLRKTTAAMDGECFHRSRLAVEAARKRRLPGVVILSGDPVRDAASNAVCGLLAAVSAHWTEKQLRSVMAYRERATEQAAATALGVAQPTLHQSLEGARGKEFVEGFSRLLEFLRLYRAEGSRRS
jgi:hypothetical protein